MIAVVTGVRLSLWRAVVVFRVAALLVCVYLVIRWYPLYPHPGAALVTALAMAAITGGIGALGWVGRAHRWSVVGPDIVLTAALTLLTLVAQSPGQRHGSQLMPTLTTVWAAGPALEAALMAGWWAGLAAGLVQVAAAIAVRGGIDGQLWSSAFVLLAAATVTGFVASLAVRAEADVAAAAAERAALAERERLARSIHDGVLQVLGLTHLLGRSADGDFGRVAALAGEQEASLRALITTRTDAGAPTGTRDLAAALRTMQRERVGVAIPAEPVPVPARFAAELVAAVDAALHNVEQHAGVDARAWVLLEEDDDRLTVTVRDDGVGFGPDRLARASVEGRLGVVESIQGRAQDLGGRADVTATPGGGTVVTIVVPVPRRDRP